MKKPSILVKLELGIFRIFIKSKTSDTERYTSEPHITEEISVAPIYLILSCTKTSSQSSSCAKAEKCIMENSNRNKMEHHLVIKSEGKAIPFVKEIIFLRTWVSFIS